MRAAFQMLAQGDGSFLERAKRLGDETDSQYVQEIVAFIMGESDRSFLTPR
jgi:UDP-N-acetylglucosamine acyltransferase